MARKRNYRKEYDDYHGKPEQIARRSARNKARKTMVKRYGKAALAGKEVDHRDMNPTNNSAANLAIKSRRANRRRQPKRK